MVALNSVSSVNIQAETLDVNSVRIFELLGYEDNEPESFVKETVLQYIEICKKTYNPSANIIVKEIVQIQADKGIVSLNDTFFSAQKIITNQLKGAQYVALFICTIGKETELLTKKLFATGDNLEAYITSLVASEAADSLAAYLHKHIEQIAIAENLNITNRFSPGYCNWDVAEQKKLFSFFPNNTCGISLNDSALMNPIKSVSGIIGIGRNLSIKQYPCKVCSNEYCLYRQGHH